ncbi:MAG: CpsD/CapB family tyrosine-protein kinase [Vicinamibacterales bacterium]
MSRIQDILNKAERDGTARRTRSLPDEYSAGPALDEEPPESRVSARSSNTDRRVSARSLTDETIHARAYADVPPAAVAAEPPRTSRPVNDVSRAMHSSRNEATAAAVAPEPWTRQTEDVSLAPETAPGEDEAAADLTPRALAELDQHLVAALAPTSIAAEQYRSLRTRLKRVESGRSLRAIAVTSPAKGDGKSLTAANLALTMAQEFQQRVLLLDADLRRPSVHRLFGLAEGPGLGDVLLSLAELDQALVFVPDHHLTVLPAGVPPSHPAELLGSAAMRRVLDTLRTRFDRILIDVPPVAPLADLHILAPMVDGLLMIVRAGITPKPAIERALAGLDSSKVLGLVLNESGGEGPDAYHYEGYGYLAG